MKTLKIKTDRLTGLVVNEGDAIRRELSGIGVGEKTVLGLGLGVSPSPLPFRYLSYLVPVTRLLDGVLTKNTQVEVYFALEGALRANRFDRSVCERRTSEARKMIHTYIRKLYSTHTRQISLLSDRKISNNTFGNDPVLRFASGIKKVAERVIANDSALSSFVKKCGSGAIGYMIEHMLYMRDPVRTKCRYSDLLLVPEMETDMNHIIMVGGQAEKVFYRFRQLMLHETGVHSKWKSHQLFAYVGSPPTYFMQKGELTWREVVEGTMSTKQILEHTRSNVRRDFGMSVGVMRDIAVLLSEVSGELDDFRPVVAAKKFLKPRTVEQNVWKILDRGLEKLRDTFM